ncbi:SRPBCC family protein [Domibacillus aminovorans]|uniref:Cell division protein n=1 Tax=Domibacillus aminovorans TaxID=29332 RepID=A0A177LAP2_9BACI|nr:SRPBCC family protein [Domibacillus aminovorans]OAH62377.1 cell division protein [Domibacillus aminovorans]
MPIIEHQQFIKAPIEVCFDLARNVDIHTQTTSKTKEKVVGGVTEGLLEKGDTVTWEAVHFGIKQRLTARVTEMEKPDKFIDIMVKGAFHSFVHTHEFIEEADGTIMIDKLILEKYMRTFIVSRAKELKKIAENLDSLS